MEYNGSSIPRRNTRRVNIEAIIDGMDEENYFLKADEDSDPTPISRRLVRIKKKHPYYAELSVNEDAAIEARLV